MVRRLPPEISSKKRALRPPTTASCFATSLVPHVLFAESFEERRKIAKACCLAWNIALFPDADERERRLEAALDVITGDGDAPPGFREGFADELRMLAEAKRDLSLGRSQTCSKPSSDLDRGRAWTCSGWRRTERSRPRNWRSTRPSWARP